VEHAGLVAEGESRCGRRVQGSRQINFFKGASLSDPQGLFNAGLDAKATRAIDIREGDRINGTALKDLIRAAVAMNSGSVRPAKTGKR
jgi:hypothetical protein